MPKNPDACVIGSGPNGLAAAITLAEAGLSVALYEAKASVGGGMRSAALTLPGFTHDICSAIHPLALSSPFFQKLPLKNLHWIFPPLSLAHPFEDGSVAVLGPSDGPEELRGFFAPFVKGWKELAPEILQPLHIPAHPLLLVKFGIYGMRSAETLWKKFRHPHSRALIAGLAGHSMLPLTAPLSAAFGLVLGTLALAVGWPVAQGGSQAIAEALAAYFTSLKGEIFLHQEIERLDQLPAKLILCDLTPKQLLAVAGEKFPESYRRKLESYRYGPGVFKMDWALSQPIPWKAQECYKAATVHLGGSAEEIARAEQEVFEGRHPERPFIILAQQSLFDATRAPPGQHTAWGYCHVPNGSTQDMTEQIETQIERYAPGFRDCILARCTHTAQQMEAYNPNYVGGDINGGVQDLRQLFSRPAHPWNPYATPLEGVYICSSSTPPGGGVHGMCGYNAARVALKKLSKLG